MSGLLGSLHAAKSGMTVSQTSIQTTSHNINNMNTPGYSRQKVEQSAKSAYSYPGYNSSIGAGQIGTGVEATDIVRIRNTFYDFQYRSESCNYGEISVKYDYYKNIETLFNEPSDTSISSYLGDFFSSWQELSKNPSDIGSKDIVIQNSKYLADSISNIKKKLDQLSEQANKKLDDDINDINNQFKYLKDIEKQIKIIQANGKSPNDLMDEKDNIIDDLNFKFNLNNDKIREALDNGITGVKLDSVNKKLTISYDESTKQIDISIKDISGEIKGSIDMIDKIQEYNEDLKSLATAIVSNTNTIAGTDLFKSDIDKNSLIYVNDEIIKNSQSWEVTVDIAQTMYDLKDKKLSIGDKKDITINKFYNSVVQKLGNESQEVIRSEKNQSKILEEIENTRTNTSGVSLDEEMVNLVQFQHAYNASAKLISTIDSLLDVVINGLKR